MLQFTDVFADPVQNGILSKLDDRFILTGRHFEKD